MPAFNCCSMASWLKFISIDIQLLYILLYNVLYCNCWISAAIIVTDILTASANLADTYIILNFYEIVKMNYNGEWNMDLEYAKRRFEEYLDGYDRRNDKIRLKIVHTYGVMECSRQIAKRLGLSKEDESLAELIGLLHDIGRFEQLKRFDSFEPGTMDHAAFGAEILFTEGMIREFVREDTEDDIIRTAILKHSDFKLEGIDGERTLLHAKLIRDADKLDNCRVKLEDPIETLLGVSKEEAGRSRISPEVMEQFMSGNSIQSETRKTKMDYWVSYLAYFFDINFDVSLDIIREQKFAERMIERIPCEDPDTAQKMEIIRRKLKSLPIRGRRRE